MLGGIGGVIQDYVVHHRPVLCTTNLRLHHGAQGEPMSVRSGGCPQHSIFVVDNKHANQGSQSSSVLTYTLVVHNVVLSQLGGAQGNFCCIFCCIFYAVFVPYSCSLLLRPLDLETSLYRFLVLVIC